ncbi:MAG: flagellar basal body protein [Lachnospiraceae bacterium]|nr:flagellar basal body protein [Lachnospiraceae bacterium]
MVRATFAGFSTALSALQANQKRLDIVGHNLANMNTVGYTRQQLETSSLNYTTPVSNYMNGSEVIVGFGVHMNKVSQIRDPYLDVQYRSQMQKSGYTDALQTSLDSLAKIFDESDTEGMGIHQAFLDIRNTLLNMQDGAKINDSIYETELRTKMQALTNLLNDADRQITEAEQLEFQRLTGKNTSERGSIEEVNDILMQIGNLNRQIKQNQILGQQSLELMDERNVLLDELSSYIPIEVTYYKDRNHDGIVNGTEFDATPGEADAEIYHLDSNGNPMFKKEWPDDLRVEMVYYDENGTAQRLTLIEGTEGSGSQNYGKLELTGDITDPTNFSLTITGSAMNLADAAGTQEILTLSSKRDANGKVNGIQGAVNGGAVADGIQLDGGSIKASLDMLWKTGDTTNNVTNDVKGYEYYREELNTLAAAFADVINAINKNNHPDANKPNAPEQNLLVNKVSKNGVGITAANIGINPEWVTHAVSINRGGTGDNPTDAILSMIEAMDSTWPNNNSNLNFVTSPDLKNNTFADYMNHISTVLANDSYSNTMALKTNVTVLNGIQNSRDSMSGVSLNEEASNMMMFQSAYQAASRLMTALDQVLDVLINSTGTCGR